MKKAVSLLLSILLIVVVLPMGIFGVTAADQTFTNGNFTYKVVNGEAIIVSAAEGLSGALVIPSELDGYTVTAIGPKAFYNFKNLTEVTIPSTIKSMGKNAFMNCTKITKINITDLKAWCEMERFGALASPMIYAKKLYLNGALVEGNITIPEGTKAITQGAFYSCKDIKNVTLPNTITYIGESAFNGCEYLASINIPNSVTEIGDWAFTGCKRLSSISIPSSVTKIGEGTFYYAQWLETIDLPDTITYIGPSAFNSTDFYYSLPDDVVYIGKVLYVCRGECPTNLVVKEGTVSIADKAFGDAGYINSGYSELESVTIPSSVKYIGESAFYNCSNLAQINFDGKLDYLGKHAFGNTAWYNAKPDGMVYVGNFAYKYKGECPEQVTITDGTAGITAWAFQSCTNLSKINIPSSVKYIGDSAFYGCSNLENINIASSSQLKSMPLSAIEQTKWYKNKDYGPVYAGNVLLAYKLPYGEDGPREIILNSDTVGVVDSVFMNCMVLSSLTFSKKLTNLLPSSFDYTYIDTINFKGTRNDWQAMSYSDCRQLAGTHVVCTCTGAHSFDNDADTTCNNCDYIKKAYTPGDINDSGARPDLDDVVVLAQIIAGWEGVTHNAEALDVNADNDVTLDDVVLLAQFVAGWDVTLN